MKRSLKSGSTQGFLREYQPAVGFIRKILVFIRYSNPNGDSPIKNLVKKFLSQNLRRKIHLYVVFYADYENVICK